MKFFFIIAIVFSAFSCYSYKNHNKDIIIVGHIKNLPSKVYLANAHKYNQFVDSAICVNDEFIFHINSEKEFHPFMASISYIDKWGKTSTLDFTNHILSKRGQRYSINSFLMEKGTTRLNGTADIREDRIKGTNISIHIDSINIAAGQETDAFFSTQRMNFGYLESNVQERTAQLDTYISIIKEYPGSEYLLSQINENKSVINKGELELLLQNFNIKVIRTDLGKKLQEYLAKKVDNPIFENLKLEGTSSNPSNIFDSTAKVNMLVVWASWCRPCRQEIPEIKKLYNLYNKNGLSITSISIDNTKESWQNALKVENMSWRQLIVPSGKINKFNTTFEVGSIPYIIFLDSGGKLLKRFIGYDKNSIGEYTQIIKNRVK
jgi:thiol-disulfide isomerase/thioredoxin